ncbi:hypothetical protein H5410_003381, partial [Solanum commersonii]
HGPTHGTWTSNLSSTRHRNLHGTSHEPWLRPLAVKWLVKVSHFEAALRELLPCLHGPHHIPWSTPMAVVVVVELRQCAPSMGKAWPLAWALPLCLGLASTRQRNLHGTSHEPWLRPLVRKWLMKVSHFEATLRELLSCLHGPHHNSLASTRQRNLHRTSHEPWLRPLAVKWLMKVSHCEATLRELPPCLHGSHHKL